jgi:hypothetical protein
VVATRWVLTWSSSWLPRLWTIHPLRRSRPPWSGGQIISGRRKETTEHTEEEVSISFLSCSRHVCQSTMSARQILTVSKLVADLRSKLWWIRSSFVAGGQATAYTLFPTQMYSWSEITSLSYSLFVIRFDLARNILGGNNFDTLKLDAEMARLIPSTATETLGDGDRLGYFRLKRLRNKLHHLYQSSLDNRTLKIFAVGSWHVVPSTAKKMCLKES